ncbi:MAG: bacteriohemerythrin [Thermodesulfobacteriota bacterium]
MSLVQWDDSLAIGVKLIDTQHKELFRIINSFSERIGKEDPSFTLRVALDSLKSYVHYHFATEEKLLQKNRCPLHSRHQGMHAAFAGLMAKYEERQDSIDREGLLELQAFLVDWLTTHIKKQDMPLRAYFAP